MKKLLIFILIFFAGNIYAQNSEKTYSKDDFAYGFIIDDLPGDYDMPYVLTLPEHVYQGAYDANLSDIMLFNGRGETMPFKVLRPLPASSRSIPDETLPFFTITDTIDNKTYVSDVIVDISNLPGKIERMIFSFSGEEEFNADVEISDSTGNLNSWGSLTEENIAYLKSGENSLIRNTVSFQKSVGNAVKYLKIHTNPLIAAGQITEVRVGFASELVYEKADYIKLAGTPVHENFKQSTFSLDGYYPVEWVHFDIPSSYLFPSFSLAVWNGNNYMSLHNANLSLSNYPLDPSVSGTAAQTERYKDWRLTAGADLPEGNIYADFYWRADELVFLSKGEGPYTLAYGNAEFRPDDAMFRAADAVESYHTDAKIVSGDFSRVEFAGEKAYERIIPPEPSNTMKYVLIAVLAVIVLVMTLLTVRLILDINRKQN
jgi:hypothetical protein